MFNFLFKKPTEEVPAASAELPKRIENSLLAGMIIPNPASDLPKSVEFDFPLECSVRAEQKIEENESDFHGAACYRFTSSLGFTIALSRDFDRRLVVIRKKQIAGYERHHGGEDVQKFLRLFNFRDDDFEGAGRYLLGASYAVGRDSRAEISHTIPYNPKSTQLAEGWCDAYAVLLREHDRVSLKMSATAALFNKAMEVLNEAAQSYQQLVQMDAKLNEKMTAIAKKIGKL